MNGSAKPRPWRPAAATAALVLLATALCFGRALHAPFVSDDTNAIVTNQWVRGELDVTGIFSHYSWWSIDRADAPGYRPLATLSFAVTHAIAGLTPSAFHLVNWVIHTTVSLAVFAAALSLGFAAPAAGAAALLFAVLPIHSEAVLWAVGLAELLAAAGFLGALLCGMRYLRGAPVAWAALSALCLVAGALCKENAVTVLAAPAILGLFFDGPDRRKRALFWALWLLAAFAAYLALRHGAGAVLAGGSPNQLDNSLSVLPWWQRQLAALSVAGRYLWLSLVPSTLSIDYSHDALGIGKGFFADRYSLLALAALCAAAFALRAAGQARRALACTLLLGLAAYAIVSNTVLVIGTAMGERLFYLPSFALCIVGGYVFERAYTRAPRPAAAVLAALITVYAGVDVARSTDWSSEVRLFESAVRAYPRSARARLELAGAYGREGRIDDALGQYGHALTILPDYAAAAFNRGNLLVRVGRAREAEASFVAALQSRPNWTSGLYNLALTRRMLGDIDGAIQALERVERARSNASVEQVLGELLLGSGRPAEAAEAYTRALALGAEARLILVNRGVALQRTRGCTAALPVYLEATRVENPIPQAFANAAECLREAGRDAEAAEMLRLGQVANRPSRR